ncbi:CGNR zinc finger domain-containing protein [Streptacidiphilus fuscans]|uniref:ABATE domain-containing protein n=1 Tax=Streptacidiphilus fuscans TaxID=2789292 RepID=A0A931B9W4_9ACTN|nr:ABATE domain-containing protein [Streptacidiphilus fuscans]MBF9072232.1 ABATE domain-containing protein [Streptacidiphilus fuscans]
MTDAGAELRDWVWYGGRPSLDFVNTLRDRFAGGRELLVHAEDLATWCQASGATAAPPSVDDALLHQARELREAIDTGLSAIVRGTAFPAEAADVLNVWLTRAAQHAPRLELTDGTPVFRPSTVPDDAHGVLCRIALDAAEVLGSDLRQRLRICDGVGCSARFIDHSAGGRRRWCSMSACGNRAKANRHRRASVTTAVK